MTTRTIWRPHVTWRPHFTWRGIQPTASLSASVFVRLMTPRVTARLETPRPFVRVTT